MIEAVRLSASVFSREAIRAARRWQTWLQRAAFSSVLLAWVVSSWTATEPLADPTTGQGIGRDLFLQYAYGQLFLVVLLAPIVVGQGVLEEREESTLDLLALTRLSARQILWGKAGSRLMVLATWILAGAPVLAVCTTFGGVGPWQVVNVVANTLLALVMLGALGALVALILDGTLAIALAVGAWAVGSMLVAPSLYMIAVREITGNLPYAHLSPPFAFVVADPTGLLPLAAAVPILLVATRWAGPLFAAGVVASDERRPDSPEAQALRERARWAGWGGLVVLVAAPFLYVAVRLLDSATGTWSWPPLVQTGLMWTWWVALLASWTALFVLVLVRGAAIRRYLAVQRAALIHMPAPGSPLRLFRLLRGRVWGHPIVWREVITNAYGASSVLGRWAFPLWVVGLGVFSASVFGIADTATLYEVTGFLLGAVVCLFMASETIASERRARTLELVSQSTMHSLSLVAGKVVAVALVGGPYIAVAASVAIVSFLLRDSYWLDDPGMQYTRAWCGHWSIGWGNRTLRVAVTALWFPAVWGTLVHATMLAAMWVRQPRQAPIAALIIAVSFLTIPAVMSEWIDGPLGNRLGTLAWPFDVYWRDVTCGTSPWMFASVLVYALAACGLFLACAASIRLVVRRDAR